VYSNKYSNEAALYVQTRNATEFVDLLRGRHERIISDKDKAGLISPAIFDGEPIVDPKDGKTKWRGNVNILCMGCAIWLDFEKGDLKPEVFPQIFPDLQMVVTNSFRHQKARPRFRVVIFTTGPLTADAYETVILQIKHKLTDAGYETKTTDKPEWKPSAGKKCSGLDWGKRAASSLFLLPSQAKDPTQSFFDVYMDDGRKPLSVTTWLENGRYELSAAEKAELFPAPIHAVQAPETLTKEQSEITERLIAAAEARFRTAAKGEGHHAFYLLRNEYLYAGCDLFETESRLQVMARSSRSPKERAAEIPDLMSTAHTFTRRSRHLFDFGEKTDKSKIDPKVFKSDLSFLRAKPAA
jgi:hypothetical protein